MDERETGDGLVKWLVHGGRAWQSLRRDGVGYGGEEIQPEWSGPAANELPEAENLGATEGEPGAKLCPGPVLSWRRTAQANSSANSSRLRLHRSRPFGGRAGGGPLGATSAIALGETLPVAPDWLETEPR